MGSVELRSGVRSGIKIINSMRSLRDLITKSLLVQMVLMVALLSGCSTDDDDDLDDTTTDTTDEESTEAVEWIDEQLSTYYLYNDEYNAMERDLTLDYSSFLNTTLMSMETNVLDKKYCETLYNIAYYDYYLYSYVIRTEVTKSRAILDSREDIGYGFVSTELVRMADDGSMAIAVHGVYKDSPVAESGVSRGSIITAISGQTIDYSNYYFDLIYLLLYPSEGDELTITTSDNESYTLTASTIEINPVLHSEVIDPGVGYVVYSCFDNNFDDDLASTLSELSTAGITDLILDLRLNPGGYVSSSNKLSSIIGGSYTSGKVFSYYRMNEDMTNDYSTTSRLMGMNFDSSQRAFYDNFVTTSTTLSLPSPKIYCLVGESTASASEMLINSLRGVGFDVVLIGEATEGKNVGMITLNETFDDGYEYDLLPITFENLNCNMEGGYQDGMEVDYAVNDLVGFSDYGADEPLVAKALELITGVVAEDDNTRAVESVELIRMGTKANSHRRGGSIVDIRE